MERVCEASGTVALSLTAIGDEPDTGHFICGRATTLKISFSAMLIVCYCGIVCNAIQQHPCLCEYECVAGGVRATADYATCMTMISWNMNALMFYGFVWSYYSMLSIRKCSVDGRHSLLPQILGLTSGL